MQQLSFIEGVTQLIIGINMITYGRVYLEYRQTYMLRLEQISNLYLIYMPHGHQIFEDLVQQNTYTFMIVNMQHTHYKLFNLLVYAAA